jgi:anthranilate synthase/aminodeoxychorismate synthase-like glutamine amidotransferase
MLLLIDNHDSFTHNLAHLLATQWEEPLVLPVDQATPSRLRQLEPAAVVLSPGPGRPRQCRGLTRSLRHFAGQRPMLGICLGHQAMGEFLGLRLVRAPRPVHGHAVPLRHNRQGLFAHCPPAMEVARYHSLVLEPASVPGLELDAWCDPQLPMALRHEPLGLWGLQFHPESFLCPHGAQLVQAFREAALAWRPACTPPVNLPH